MKATKYLERNSIGECEEGWRGLIEPLVKAVAAVDGSIFQIKEKFGGLRFYYHDEAGDPEIRAMVDKAEHESYKICEKCGQPGRVRYGGWMLTLCDTHAKERRAERGIADGMDELENQP